uniref:J domain-containing protein n=1 Tax=Ditylenchus dipsaci TaxID=166011 RepID=A0A915EBZ1_9BILA
MSNVDLYTLLGCDATSTTDQILAEFRSKVREIHPDKMEAAQKSEAEVLFHELNYAKEVLCNPSKRQHYDLFLRMGEPLNVSLKEWMENQDRLQQTLHWANQTNESMPMLQDTNKSTSAAGPSSCKSELEQTGSQDTSFQLHSTSPANNYPRRFEAGPVTTVQ